MRRRDADRYRDGMRGVRGVGGVGGIRGGSIRNIIGIRGSRSGITNTLDTKHYLITSPFLRFVKIICEQPISTLKL